MTDDLVKPICQAWIESGRGDECFWEWWPGCPTENDSLSAQKVFDRIEELEGQLQSVLDRETSILRYYDAKMDEAYAKLAGAVEDFEKIAGTDPDDGTAWFHEFADTAIAKIKGEQP